MFLRGGFVDTADGEAHVYDGVVTDDGIGEVRQADLLLDPAEVELRHTGASASWLVSVTPSSPIISRR